MSEPRAWILLRIPRAAGATTMSGVLSADGQIAVAGGSTIAEVCDALLAKAQPKKPVLILPLDGRHGLAGNVLDEATKRGWEFSRHVPAGNEKYLLDLDGADAAATLTAQDATSRLEPLAGAMGEAWNDNELGESMGIGRQALTLCLRHFGAWHVYTFWIMSNLMQAAAGTGADKNVREACGLVEHLLSHDMPKAFGGEASGLVVKADELARRCVGAGEVALATRVYDAAIAVARAKFGEEHEIYAGITSRKAGALGAP